MTLATCLTWLSGGSFLVYGVLCLGATSMVDDFERFGLVRLRKLTGILELLGGTGLLVGLVWTPALLVSSAGLALLMLIAFGIRVKMRDSIAASLPSLALMFVNLYILVEAVR